MKPTITAFLLALVPVSLGLFSNLETSAAPGLRNNKVFLFRTIPYEARPGENIVLEGSGFSKGSNKVYFNGTEIGVASSTNGTRISLNIPNSLAESQYKISISNILGSSENLAVPIYIKVTNSPQPPPVIERATLSGETITVTGKNFTAANTVITTLGTKNPIPSDGTTISFRLNELPQYEQVKKMLKNNKYQFSLLIFIQSEHGVNKDAYRLDMTI